MSSVFVSFPFFSFLSLFSSSSDFIFIFFKLLLLPLQTSSSSSFSNFFFFFKILLLQTDYYCFLLFISLNYNCAHHFEYISSLPSLHCLSQFLSSYETQFSFLHCIASAWPYSPYDPDPSQPAGQHQPRLPSPWTRILPQQGRRQRHCVRWGVQNVRVSRWVKTGTGCYCYCFICRSKAGIVLSVLQVIVIFLSVLQYLCYWFIYYVVFMILFYLFCSRRVVVLSFL